MAPCLRRARRMTAPDPRPTAPAILIALALPACALAPLHVLLVPATAAAQDAAPTPAPAAPVPATLTALSPDRTPLGECPLERTDVSIEVSGFVVRARVEHRFANPFRERIEAVYAFPLPERAAVRDMEMHVADRVVRADIQRRDEARATYERARSEGRTTSLLEQERPNVFTASVANVRPGEPVRVILEYVEVLEPDAGRWELAFPMTIGPRFVPGEPLPAVRTTAAGAGASARSGTGWSPDTDRVPDASRITPPVAPPGRSGHDVSLSVTLRAGAPIGSLEVPTHDVSITRGSPMHAEIALAPHETIPNRDFVLRWTVDPTRVGAAVLTHRARTDDDGYLTLMLQSRSSPPPDEVTPREIVFVLDTSGSMYGQPMDLSKELMRTLIADLRPSDSFAVLRYSDSASSLWSAPMPATEARRREALAFVESLSGEGGTDALGGVRAAFAYPHDPARLRIVVFLTDGYIGGEREVLGEIQREIRDARLFSFGVGSSVNRYLLEEMAREGRGDAAIVTLRHDPHAEVRRFYERMRRPYLTDVSVDWGGLAVDRAYPARIPDLFAGQPVLVHARYARPGRGTITVRGRLAGQPFEQQIAVELPALRQDDSAIASVWARERIGELERRMHDGDDPALVSELTDVALSHRLVSRFTSFVAVEERREVRADGSGEPRTVVVPVELPEGVSASRVFGSSLSLARFQPGDPELRVEAPPSARAVVASFPFGETRTLRFEPRLGLWTTRFLVPRGTPEGNYHIAIVVTMPDGSQERLDQGYTVDGSAPEVELELDGIARPGAEVRLVARQRFTHADRALHGRRRRTQILSDVARIRVITEDGATIRMTLVEPGVWEGTWAVPADASGEATLALTAFDVAGNRGTRAVRVEIEEE